MIKIKCTEKATESCARRTECGSTTTKASDGPPFNRKATPACSDSQRTSLISTKSMAWKSIYSGKGVSRWRPLGPLWFRPPPPRVCVVCAFSILLKKLGFLPLAWWWQGVRQFSLPVTLVTLKWESYKSLSHSDTCVKDFMACKYFSFKSQSVPSVSWLGTLKFRLCFVSHHWVNEWFLPRTSAHGSLFPTDIVQFHWQPGENRLEQKLMRATWDLIIKIGVLSVDLHANTNCHMGEKTVNSCHPILVDYAAWKRECTTSVGRDE